MLLVKGKHEREAENASHLRFSERNIKLIIAMYPAKIKVTFFSEAMYQSIESHRDGAITHSSWI